MTLERETIAIGANARCPDCGVMPAPQVCQSGGGYYIGSWCHCGPYTRESGYYPTRASAERAFHQGGYGR